MDDCKWARLALAMSFGLSLSSVTSAAGARAVEFPYRVTLDSNHRFIVYGQELTNTVTFDFDGVTLRANGLQILPRPPHERIQLPDSQLVAFYGAIPFVQRCLENGGAIRDCSEQFHGRRNAMVGAIGERYRRLREELLGRADSLPAESLFLFDRLADSALTALDPEIVGNLEEARRNTRISHGGVLTLGIPGLPIGIASPLLDPPVTRHEETLTEEQALAYLHRCLQYLELPLPGFYFVSRTGGVGASGEAAFELFRDVDGLRADPQYVPQHLSPNQVDHILNPGWR